jgi:serine/threonine-protein kinase
MNHNGFTWSPDGREIAFYSVQGSHSSIYRMRADGTGKPDLVTEFEVSALVTDWTADGKNLIVTLHPAGKPYELWVAPLTPGQKPYQLIAGPYSCRFGMVSPNGKWITYVSNETGQAEVYVQSFPPGAGKWQISTNGGDGPTWRADGKELLYVQPDRPAFKFMAAPVKTDAVKFDGGSPVLLFEAPEGSKAWAFTADAQKVLSVTATEKDNRQQAFSIVVNWLAGVKQ